MSDLAVRTSEVADRIGDVLDILADDEATLADWAAAFAVGQQLRLRLDRGLKSRRDDLIVGMERDGLKELGPLSIKSAAVDPKYDCNEAGNWEDEGIQSAMAGMWGDPELGKYVLDIPNHYEIDVLALTEDIRLGVDAAIALYRELNRRRWRTEQARRLSLVVREVKGTKAA